MCNLHFLLRTFLLSLAFLTRLGPAFVANVQEMVFSCLWYPLVGAILGAILLLPVQFISGSPFIAAWLYVLLSLWLTRGLHADGLADLADALGSNKVGDAFFSVLKDSRIGAFGVLALLLAYSGQGLFAAGCIEKDFLLPLFFAPVFGRCLPICLACLSKPHPKASLGALLASAPPLPCLALAFALSLVLGPLCLGVTRFFMASFFAFLLLMYLTYIARRMGGWNGDYNGAAIVIGECICLFVGVV